VIGSCAHPSSYRVDAGGIAAGTEVYHSPPSSAEVKDTWSCTSTTQYVFMALCLVTHLDDFTSLFFGTVTEIYCPNVIVVKTGLHGR
jgi:hypothetical protein